MARVELAIFGKAPSFDDQAGNFTGKAGRELWAGMLRHVGLERSDFYVSNILKDVLPKNRDPKPEEIAAAIPEFLDELERVQPRVIVTSGSFSTHAVLGDVKMSDVHGIPHMVMIAGRDYCCFPIYDPGAGLQNKGYLAAFAYDLKRLRAFLDDDLLPWCPSGRPVRTSWLSRAAIHACEALEGPLTVAVDTEGWGDWGLSFSPDGINGYVIRKDDAFGMAWFNIWIEQASRVVGHNLLHDLPVLSAMGISLDGLMPHDTQVLAYHDMLRTGSGVLEAESQNLGTLAYRYLGMQLRELSDCTGVDFDEQIIPYSDEVMEYAATDPIATWRLFQIYDALGIVNLEPYQIDMGQLPLVEQMIAHGIPFDVDETAGYYAELLDKLEVSRDDLRAKAARYGNRDFNPGSADQVRDLLTKKLGLRIRKRTKGGQASTNEKALADFRDEPFVKQIQDYRELVKLRGTYAEPLLEELSR